MSDRDIKNDNYDRGITPAETAARQEREGENFKHTPQSENNTDLDTTGGYTVDREGLLNNFAVEPEIYYEEPGDARDREEELAAQRREELEEINEDKQGELSAQSDNRGKGQGMI